ncbi:YbjN domain-containing protein [Arcanobacterium haemolyticum]|nr:YbjN domain-containing protein [Arcanobacterium haemolyticum]
MGFFSKDASSPSANPLAPLSIDRVKEALDRDDVKYFLDDDGDVAAGWDNAVFFFMLGGQNNEYLRIQGRWHVELPAGRLNDAVEICNRWNTRSLWPKTYAVINDSNNLIVMAEHNVDYEHGVTDEQIQLNIRCALSTSMQFFEHLAEAFPEEWKAFEAERDSRQ